MKNTIKKILAVVLCLAFVFAFAACSGTDNGETTTEANTSSAASDGKTLKIGIIQYVSHPSLDNCYQGIKNALDKSGLNLEIDRQIGSDSAADSDCASYAKNMVAQKYDMIFAIATPAATAAYAATEGTEIPVIFCAVSDPVAAKLVDSNDA
ncbi:MAG: ABC transporter substrate binding protein, partial [Acutalibacteraceae bacterium]